MNKTIIFAISLCILLAAIFIYFEHKKQYVLATIFKALASLMFVYIGYQSYVFNNDFNYIKLIFYGLICGLIGDVLLELRFVFLKQANLVFLSGIALFLAGHILYLVALLPHSVHLFVCIIIGSILACGLLCYIFKTMEVKMSFKIFGIIYLNAILIMTSIALGIAIDEPLINNNIFSLGAIAFAISDIVLIFNTFSKTSKFSLRITNLSFYYLGQLLIACSLIFININTIA